MPEVAMTQQFLEDLLKLPKHLAKKCIGLTDMLSSTDTASVSNLSPGWRLHGLRNSPFLSLSLDMNFRVLLRRESDGRLILHRALKHDDAYREETLTSGIESTSFELRQIRINPSDLYSTLIAVGIPPQDIAPLQSVQDEDDLIEAITLLREDIGLLAIELYEHELIAYQKTKYVVYSGEQEVLSVLQKPLDDWMLYLHPSQRYVVELPHNIVVCVQGSAGTGKTVCALHRLEHLVAQGCRVAFICLSKYTALLAQPIIKKLEGGSDRIKFVSPHRREDFADVFPGYSHYIIDEAQDFPGEWFEEVFRKTDVLNYGTTILYDFNQITPPHSAKNAGKKFRRKFGRWERAIVEHLDPIQLRLVTNYRNSESIARYIRQEWNQYLPVPFESEM
jgi:hypothetical protein